MSLIRDDDPPGTALLGVVLLLVALVGSLLRGCRG